MLHVANAHANALACGLTDVLRWRHRHALAACRRINAFGELIMALGAVQVVSRLFAWMV